MLGKKKGLKPVHFTVHLMKVEKEHIKAKPSSGKIIPIETISNGIWNGKAVEKTWN